MRPYWESLDQNDEPYQCECHRRLGTDFFFLPADFCLQGKCTDPKGRDEPINWYFWIPCIAVVLIVLAFWAYTNQAIPRCKITGDREFNNGHCIPYCPPRPSECD